ncbi:Cation/H(+) antiporter 14 [Bienertia sinuspersici]
MGALFKKIGKKTTIISFAGFIVSLAFSYTGIKVLHISDGLEGLTRMIMLNAQTFFMVTCNHVNEVGISNSELGRLACAVSLLLDIFGIFFTYLIFSVIIPMLSWDFWQPVVVTLFYILTFAVFRPLVIYLICRTPEGERMKDTHFLAIILIVLTIAFLSLEASQPLAVFLFGFFLPQEPLASVLSDRLDAISSCVFFPIFCAMHGFEADFESLTVKSIIVEILVIMGAFGKALGTLVSAMYFGVPVWTAMALSIIMASGGLLDIVMLGQFREKGVRIVQILQLHSIWTPTITSMTMTGEHYTIVSLHILFCTGAFLPLVRYMYEPSTQYSTVIRQGVITSAETGTLQVLACIHKEENLPGIIRLLEAFHPTHEKPIPIIALQLIQLTAGRVSIPVLAPLHEVQSSATFRSYLSRCNRIVQGFLRLERKTHGAARVQHYISVCSHVDMHNDICGLAHGKTSSLLLLPFHVSWVHDGHSVQQQSSQSIRDVNKMVLEKAPCSVGVLIDRINTKTHLAHIGKTFNVAIFFIGGVDDHEALAYTTIFTSHPSIKLTVVWLKGRMSHSNSNNYDDYGVIQDFHNRCNDNERVSFREVIVNDGAETTNTVVDLKDEIDLVVVGRYHEPGCAPLFGLSDQWCVYPELGILGDMLVSPEFEFSVLVVQQESHTTKTCDIDDIDDDDDNVTFGF